MVDNCFIPHIGFHRLALQFHHRYGERTRVEAHVVEGEGEGEEEEEEEEEKEE